MRTFKSKFARRGGRLTRSTKTFADSDWKEMLNQRAREINAFHRASVPLPNFEIGARVPRLYPGEPAPTVVRPEFLNSIHEEIRTVLAAQGFTTLKEEVDLDLWGQTANTARADRPDSGSTRRRPGLSARLQFFREALRSRRVDREHPLPPAQEGSCAGEEHESTRSQRASSGLSELLSFVRRWVKS
ncbi:hypothetical protein BN2476_350260 [Paraburkholderia piptadeniae]|uniref:Uncharacterized protein n=1 Tax=Paraburkholderia piptadeniae TaxID=1701573 RepID=A0A1N7S9T3_9BURK|nr:hypothetical protein [Paraburkholderia piptadeniae]SIT43728.1 hypothetical protein BN2476_350260 [Paraburkholderia piptadeniae]